MLPRSNLLQHFSGASNDLESLNKNYCKNTWREKCNGMCLYNKEKSLVTVTKASPCHLLLSAMIFPSS